MRKIFLVSCASRDFILFRLGLISKLLSENFDVHLIAPQDKYSEILKSKEYKFHGIKINRKGLNPFEDLMLFFNFVKLIKQEKPDITLNFTFKPAIYCSLAGMFFKIKIVNILEGLGYAFIKKGFIAYIVKGLCRISFKKAEKVIFLNQDDLNDFVQNKVVPVKKAELIVSVGVDMKYFSPRKRKKQNAIVFLFIGRLLWEKGVKEFVEAAKIVGQKFKNTKFEIIGWFDSGNPSAVPEKYIHDNVKQDIIVYSGNVDDVRPYIGNSDVVVLASYYREGVPHSLLEAASMERPLITTDSVGCKETVDDKINGLLVKPENIQSLANAMEWMIQHPKERLKMGIEGRRKILKELDEKIVVSKYYQIIIDTLQGS